MENLIFFEYTSPLLLLLRFLALIGISAVFIWGFILLIMRFSYNSPVDSFLLTWKFSILKSLISFVFLFSIYLFFLIKVNGLHWFNWSEFPIKISNIYFLISPEISLLLVIVIFYYYQLTKINKLIK